MSKKAELAIKGLGKAYEFGKKLFKTKQKTTGTGAINSVKPGKRLKEKRDIQDSVVKTKDKIMSGLSDEGKLNVRTNVPLKKTNKNISKILDKN